MAELDKKTLAERIDAVIEQLESHLELGRRYQALFGFSLAANEVVTDIDKLLDLILIAVIDDQGLAETGSIFLMTKDETKVKLQRKRGLHNGFVQYTEFELGEGITGIVAKTGEPLLINECTRDLRYLPFRSGTTQLRSILAVPMTVKAEILGVICIHNSTKKEGFTERDQSYLAELAKVAAIAVNNARLYDSAIWHALTDPLTMLLNRRGIEAALRDQVQKAKSAKQPLSVLFIDIDNLKYFNDSFSYETGDQVIMRVASCIKRQTFTRDIAGKWKEGDEFLVILRGTNIETAEVVAERIRADTQTRTLPRLPDKHFTVSIGVSGLGPNIQDSRSLVKAAENAKNRAKQESKNKVYVAPN